MNNLVAYDAMSDEDSPRRRSFDDAKHSPVNRREERRQSSSPRKRRDSDYYDDSEMAYSQDNAKSSASQSPQSDRSETTGFREPPPPKRPNDVHSPSPALRTPIGMPRISSTASLVSYAGKEDGFEQAERDAPKELHSPSSGTVEPRPPERISQESESDEENERLIDQVLEEGRNTLKEIECSSVEGSTPIRENDDSPKTPASIDDREEEGPEEVARIPPPPDTPVDPILQAKMENYFVKKAAGADINVFLQQKREFLNPSCYESFIERFELDEKGSNFRKSIFDPNCFPENCYYDKLNEEQRKVMDQKDGKKTTQSHGHSSAPVSKKAK